MSPELLSQSVITLLRGICWHQDQARADVESFDGRLRISFEPAPSDLRFCMGEGGRCIKGLQHIAAVIGKLNGYRTSISLIQSFDGTAEKEDHPFEQQIGFDDQEIYRIASGLLASSFAREVRLRRRRTNDLLELKTEVRTPGENVCLSALNEPLYAYGFRQGCIIKLSAYNHE